MNIHYQETCEGVTAEHLTILRNSDYIVLAIDEDTNRVMGFVTVLTDGIQAAFVSLLEVLPEFQGRGIGSELMGQVMEKFGHLSAVDLTCDPQLQTFYARFGMQPSVGAVRRNY